MPSIFNLLPRRLTAAQLRKPSGLLGRLTARVLNNRNVDLNAATLLALDLAPSDRVLEVGFGGGDLISRMLPLLPEGHISAADYSAEMVALCSKRFAADVGCGRLELAAAHIDTLPYPSGSANKACTVNTIYFWEDPPAALAELSRVLEPGGRLVIGFSPRASMVKLPVVAHGFRLYEPDEVTALLVAAGFEFVDMRDGGGPRGDSLCAIAEKPARPQPESAAGTNAAAAAEA